MALSIYDFTISEFARGLLSLSHILEKAVEYAKEKNIDVADIPGWKLVDDMNPFSFQIQTASNTAKNTIARISKEKLPAWEDNETTIEQLQARISRTLDLLKTVEKSSWADKATTEVTLQVSGTDTQMTAVQYTQNFALPNFFFHVTTAYSILRMKGVPIGKGDFLSGSKKAASEGF
jgi:hypothetical protein